MMRVEYRRISIDLIDVTADRLRRVRPNRVETLAKDIEVNGLLQPIGVAGEESGRFTLTFGLHRLHAIRSLKRLEIEARVQPLIRSKQRRVDEIMENLNREALSMLERAESLAELKELHEELYPDTRKGVAGGKARQKTASEIFSFAKEAADKTGMSRRAIEIAVAIVEKLDIDVKARLRGTWVEDHQAGLQALSNRASNIQHKVCDLLFSTPPQATNVADAIELAEGRALPTPADRAFSSAYNSLARLTERQRHTLFDQYEAAVHAYAKEKGWL